MRIKNALLATCLMLPWPALAADEAMHMQDEHGGGIYHMFRLETEYGQGPENATGHWDWEGWVGSDENKLWLKSEGERIGGRLDEAEIWALYSRNVAMYWDAQVGVRYDAQPASTGYLTLGVTGLAPYFFETEAHLFISDKGHVSARLREENDFLLTQKLILQPYVEANFYAQDVPEQHVGAGLSDIRLGLQTRYEITRKFAPYMDIHYEGKFGETSAIAHKRGEDTDGLVGSVGLRLMF